jgi:hypothetical protein
MDGETKVKTWDLEPGMVVKRDRHPSSSPVVVHDLVEATIPHPGGDVAVWLFGDGKLDRPPFVVSAGSEEEWTVIVWPSGEEAR